MSVCTVSVCFFFFNDTATTEIYTLSLHDALPISPEQVRVPGGRHSGHPGVGLEGDRRGQGVGGEGGGAARGAGQEHSDPEAGDREAVPDAGGGRVLDHGPGDGGDGPDRAGKGEGGRGSGDGGVWDGQEGGGDGGGDVPQAVG